MRTLRRYLAAEIVAATGFVLLALLALLAFFDLVHEMNDLGRGGYQLKAIVFHVLLLVPNHVYEALPLAALIGTLFALAHLVASSEYVVMRTSGVSLTRFSIALLSIGLVFAITTFVFGEFLGPPAQQLAKRIRSQAIAGIIAQEFRSGLWIKDGRNFINAAQVTANGELRGIRIYDFDDDYRLAKLTLAERGIYAGDSRWKLIDVSETRFSESGAQVQHIDERLWTTVLEPDLLSMLLVEPQDMSAWNLWSYSNFLKENKQNALRYDVAFWTKIMYPMAVLVMMILALAFAYTGGRQGGTGQKIFIGIMLGLAFHTLNRLFSSLGVLYDWPAIPSAVTPTIMFLALALGIMWWQERR